MTKYPEIKVEKFVGGNKIDWFTIAEPCEVTNAYGHPIFAIPAGYVTDFASVPRAMWSIFPPHGRMTTASIVHDYMYDRKMYEDTMTDPRLFADRLFVTNCIRDGVPVWQTWVIYSIIRLFGRSWWDN